MQQVVTSSDPQWMQADTPRKRSLRKVNSGMSEGLSDVALSEGGSPMTGAHANGHVTSAGLPLAGTTTGVLPLSSFHCLLCPSHQPYEKRSCYGVSHVNGHVTSARLPLATTFCHT